MNFSPLREKIGLSSQEFLRLKNSKPVIIWGSGYLGLCLSRKLLSIGFNKFFITDSFKISDFYKMQNNRIISPEIAIKMAKSGAATIVICVQPVPTALKRKLLESGLVEDEDFLSIQRLSRPSPVIEIFEPVSDICLSLEQAILICERIRIDYPDVFQIDLSSNGYSLNNPNIIQIASEFEKVAPCTLAFKPSNFSPSVIRECIKLNIGQITCIIDNDEIDTTFNCIESIGLIMRDELFVNSPTVVRVRFDAFENNMDGLNEIKDLCIRLKIPLVVALGYPSYYDSLVHSDSDEDFSFKPPVPVAWSFSSAKALAVKDRGLHFLCERVFPVIDAYGAARLCHLYSEITLDGDYLDVDRAVLHSKRLNALHCRTCQSQGLHRLDVAVLERRHGIQIASDNFRKVSEK